MKFLKPLLKKRLHLLQSEEILNRPVFVLNILLILVVGFTYFSSDNCTYHSLGIVLFSRQNSLKKIILFLNIAENSEQILNIAELWVLRHEIRGAKAR
jgi:hypothetical protein